MQMVTSGRSSGEGRTSLVEDRHPRQCPSRQGHQRNFVEQRRCAACYFLQTASPGAEAAHSRTSQFPPFSCAPNAEVLTPISEHKLHTANNDVPSRLRGSATFSAVQRQSADVWSLQRNSEAYYICLDFYWQIRLSAAGHMSDHVPPCCVGAPKLSKPSIARLAFARFHKLCSKLAISWPLERYGAIYWQWALLVAYRCWLPQKGLHHG